MPRLFDRTIAVLRAAAATLPVFLAFAEPTAAAGAEKRTLTYYQRLDETTNDVTTSATNYLQITDVGKARRVTVVTPSGVTHAISLEVPSNDAAAQDPAGRCYALATSLLPTAMRLSPGMRARAGQLNVTAGTTATVLPVNFAAEALTPQLERVYVYADATAAVRFTGVLDVRRGVVMAAAFTIVAATPGSASVHATRCQINLMLPNVPSSAAKSV